LLLAAQHIPTLILIHRLTLPDLTPNTGLWWYFFTEMFDHFRPFFLMVFSVCFPLVPGSRHKFTISQVHLLIYVVPICIKFQYVSIQRILEHSVINLSTHLDTILFTPPSLCWVSLEPSSHTQHSQTLAFS